MARRANPDLQRFRQVCESLKPSVPDPVEYESVRYSAGGSLARTFAVFRKRTRTICFRSVDPRVLADPRFPDSQRWGRRDEGWRQVSLRRGAIRWPELERLLTESHRLACEKKEGRAKYEFGSLQAMLGKAMETAQPEHRPPPPYHAGGPAPRLSVDGWVRACLFLANAASFALQASEKREAARIERVVEKMLAGARERAYGELARASEAQPGESRALHCYRRLAGVARAASAQKIHQIGQAGVLVAERAVQAFVEGGRPAKLATVLSDFDELLLREEFTKVIVEKGKQPSAPKRFRLLWRGADAKGEPGFWLVRLSGPNYGLLAKLGAKYSWLVGPRDDVLASVPDALFAHATSSVFSRDAA